MSNQPKGNMDDLLNGAGKGPAPTAPQDNRSREQRPATRSTETERPQRPRADRGGKLSIPAHLIKPGYVPYLAIDKPGNIEQMVANGWEFIYGDSAAGSERTSDEASQLGTKYTIPAGGGFTYFGMQIRKDWWDEIQQEKLDEINDIESAMKQPDRTNMPSQGEAYIPSGGGLKTTVQDYRKD